jgi:peptidoglycan hydrolase CwlO-like protein
MKIKIGIIVLAAACIGLLVALIATKKAAEEQRKSDIASILEFSNQLDTANINLNDERQVNLMLTNDLSALHQAAAALSNNLAETSSTLSTTKASLLSAESQVANLNSRITDLEAQNKALDERANDLTNRLAELDTLIAATQHKLASSETDNAFLTAELQKQLAQKTELERKFADLNVVRAQVTKLRDELFVTRRLQWMANGANPSTPSKGAQGLMRRSPVNDAPLSATPASAVAAPANAPSPVATPAKPASPYDLNVEVGSDGSVHVIPAATNTAAH